jgi:hypothetical protein
LNWVLYACVGHEEQQLPTALGQQAHDQERRQIRMPRGGWPFVKAVIDEEQADAVDARGSGGGVRFDERQKEERDADDRLAFRIAAEGLVLLFPPFVRSTDERQGDWFEIRWKQATDVRQADLDAAKAVYRRNRAKRPRLAAMSLAP